MSATSYKVRVNNVMNGVPYYALTVPSEIARKFEGVSLFCYALGNSIIFESGCKFPGGCGSPGGHDGKN